MWLRLNKDNNKKLNVRSTETLHVIKTLIIKPTTGLTNGQRILMKGRIAILSPLTVANGFIRPWSSNT